MIATYVPPRLTPLTFDDAAEAMRAALRDKLKANPTPEALALALAKTALETGRWKSIWCANWGNIKASATYEGMYTCITLNEVIGGKVVWFAPEGQLAGGRGTPVVGKVYDVPPGHPQTRMRAYANRFDGAFAYVDFVSGGRYAHAWIRLLAGDAPGYIRALKAKGYFTADEATYAKAVISLQKEFIAKLGGCAPEEHRIDEDEYEALRLAVAAQQFDTLDLDGDGFPDREAPTKSDPPTTA